MGLRKDLEENFDYEIVDEFLDHFAMASESMELLTINLEKPEYYKRNIDELFRIFHNIKSATAYLKITTINNFVIEVEDLLDKMRDVDGPAKTEIVDWLLLCDDQMSAWNINLRLDEDLIPLSDALIELPEL